jgi:hypothetical protein
MAWRMVLTLDAEALRTFDPLQLVVPITAAFPGMEAHRTNLYAILAELYSNGLEHGVLGLDADLKDTPQGFARYYALRERRLAELRDGQLEIEVASLEDAGGEGRLIIQVRDSGDGFYQEAADGSSEPLLKHSGRGIALVRSLCESVDYCEGGRCVTVTYSCDSGERFAGDANRDGRGAEPGSR